MVILFVHCRPFDNGAMYVDVTTYIIDSLGSGAIPNEIKNGSYLISYVPYESTQNRYEYSQI